MYGSIRMFQVQPGMLDEAISATWAACQASLPTVPGFRQMGLIRVEPDQFVTLGVYDSQAAAEAGMGITNPEFWAAVAKYFAAEPRRIHGELTLWDSDAG